ncbi:MAG: hypothetical protein ACREPQ_19435 [Rhodanobacter sp.]
MAYTKPVQTPFAANLQPHEFVVQLDTGDYVAVDAEMSVEPNTGNPAVMVSARAVDATGMTRNDSGTPPMPIASAFSHTSNQTELAALGGVNALQLQACLAVLGETTTIWNDSVHASVMENASIRTNLASAAHAGPVTDLSTLL